MNRVTEWVAVIGIVLAASVFVTGVVYGIALLVGAGQCQ